MKKLLSTYVFLLAALAAAQAQSALFVDTTVTPQQMVADFFNTGQVTVSNVTFNGSASSAAYFEAANTDLDLLAGIMLSSGRCNSAPGVPGDFASDMVGFGSDSSLTALSGITTFDAALLEFDLVSSTDTLCFIYRFGSEEYPEYVGSSFNDVFAFFVEGPGYNGQTNIALVPNTTIPVAINNVNSDFNSQYYVEYDSTGGGDAVYDGFTTTMPAKFIVQSGASYHVKLAIADSGDGIFDSSVFIAINSLGGDSLLAPVAEMAAPIIDGNTVTFTNTSRYATAWHWDFGDGTTSNERNPGPHTFPQFGPNGDERSTYVVTLITTNYCCADTTQFVVNIGSSGVDELQALPFRFGPNPVADFLLVQPELAGPYVLRALDLNGRVMSQQQANGALRLETAGWPSGVYLLEFQQGGHSAVQRVVKR
ncbi:MAG: choice-of-anchor L domain-containing protein [Saprospiraceae bacterium]|nr:choice-of-anchor L domain-containing protein [Saprospiraceae bacterium]